MARHVTTGVAAHEIGVSPATLTRWAAAGKVQPAERTQGGHYRWNLVSLRRQLRRLNLAAAGQVPDLAEDIASVVHDANRRWQIVLGDEWPSPVWDDAPERQVIGVTASVRAVLDDPGMTPEDNHERWLASLAADGWTHGLVKDEIARTHPCLVHWPDLPVHEQAKDRLLIAIVGALRP